MSQKYIGGFITKNPTAPTTSAASGMWTLDQAANYVKQGIWPSPPPPAPTVIGQSFGGGYYAGQIGVSGTATHYLIVAPIASGQFQGQWKTANNGTTGTNSDIDGPANTAAMIAAGAAAHPCGQFCDNLSTGGQTDWYMPAFNELEICYYNLKPTTTANDTGSGINPNAVPARASSYTTGNPAQTSATDFRSTGAEDFLTGTDFYWSSTQNTGFTGYATIQYFSNGSQVNSAKSANSFVRAVRRVAV